MTAVRLAELRPEDSDALFGWINDRELVEISAPFAPVERERHEAWFAAVRADAATCIFGIRTGTDDRLVGTCQLHDIHPVHRSAELQIRIGERGAWGRGIGTAAVEQLLAVGFERLRLHRVYLHVLARNERARRLYRRVGFRDEGLLREAAWIGGAWLDVVPMAVLREEARL